jgi:hypothetical protein
MIQIAFSKVIRDFVERTLLPFFGPGQPENPTLGIPRGARSAHLLLTAYLYEPVHEPTPEVKPIDAYECSRVEGECVNFM